MEELCIAIENKKGTKSWLGECEFIIKIQLCTRQIAQNPYPIRILLS